MGARVSQFIARVTLAAHPRTGIYRSLQNTPSPLDADVHLNRLAALVSCLRTTSASEPSLESPGSIPA